MHIEDPINTRPPAGGGCPPSSRDEDWIEFGDYCYLFVEEALTFSEARLQCHIRNAQYEPVSIHSEEENQFIWDHTKVPTFNGWWWTGMYRTQSSK